jgi:hypothetical protein
VIFRRGKVDHAVEQVGFEIAFAQRVGHE